MADQTSAPKSEAAVSGAPSTWPGAFGAYKYSKAAVMTNIGTLVVIWLATAILGGIGQKTLGNASGLVNLLVGSLATAAFVLTFLAGVRGQKLSVGDALSKSFPYWLKMIGLVILIELSLIVSFLLFVVPFFFVLPRLALAHYFLVDKDMGVMDAYKASWNATKGSAGKVWGIIGATILMALLMITIIGIPFSIYFLIMYSGAYAVFYEYLNKGGKPTASAPAATEAPSAA